MLKRFRLLPFLAGVAIGAAILLWFKPEKTVIYQYPHPDTVQHRVYRDRAGACYAYSAKEVNCDANEATLKDYPLQS
jgi:hypothetical protein